MTSAPASRSARSPTGLASPSPSRAHTEGELAARHGMLLYASDSVRVAGVPASPAVRAAVDARIQAVFGQIQQRVRARVDRVTIGRSRITLYLSSRPV